MDVPSSEHPCGWINCEEMGTRRCASCKNAWYCSTMCQKRDWKYHIFDCNTKGQIRTAHHLLRACRQDLAPTDQQTLADYGFDKAHDAEGKMMLLGLYQGLYNIHEHALEPRELDGWLKEGSLVKHIKEAFETLSENNRGGYYPWFLKNQWILDDSPEPDTHTAQGIAERMKNKLWDFLGQERKAHSSTWPRERKVCASLYRLLLSEFHPPPSTPKEYITFGFCVARDMYIEMSIARLYKALIRRCSFEEFCDAYESSSLIAFMESKGITDRRSLPRHFEHIMQSRVSHESVWDLKQFIYGGEMVELIPSVTCDYGFMQCRSPEDLTALTTVYKVAFDHKDFDEMELHSHCIQGKTLEYVSRFQRLTKKDKKRFGHLMKNPYPLDFPEETSGFATLSLTST